MTNNIANYNNSIFLVEVEKIRPNPQQPRNDFDDSSLNDLADSIRQYGILQPLVVTRKEEQSEDGGLRVFYELIAGERRLRASKIAGLPQVPVIIRSREETDRTKLELAIIENLQREDLNPIDRALAFEKLTGEFGMTHLEVGKKMGKSREYVSNSLRLLQMPEVIKEALRNGKIAEGHSRPIMMLRDHPDEQMSLFKEIVYKKLSVRDAEKIARSIAVEKVRKVDNDYDPAIAEYEKKFSEKLGTRVMIEKKQRGVGGRLMIDFISPIDLENFLALFRGGVGVNDSQALMKKYFDEQKITDFNFSISKDETSPKSDFGQNIQIPAEKVPTIEIDNINIPTSSNQEQTNTLTEEHISGYVDDYLNQKEKKQQEQESSLQGIYNANFTIPELSKTENKVSLEPERNKETSIVNDLPVEEDELLNQPIDDSTSQDEDDDYSFLDDLFNDVKTENSPQITKPTTVFNLDNLDLPRPVELDKASVSNQEDFKKEIPEVVIPSSKENTEKSLADILKEIDSLDFSHIRKDSDSYSKNNIQVEQPRPNTSYLFENQNKPQSPDPKPEISFPEETPNPPAQNNTFVYNKDSDPYRNQLEN